MARGNDRQTGYEEVAGQTSDISEWMDFKFYDLVWWLDQPKKPNFTDHTRRLAQWLGVLHRIESDWIWATGSLLTVVRLYPKWLDYIQNICWTCEPMTITSK
jgi:hypothetical protein